MKKIICKKSEGVRVVFDCNNCKNAMICKYKEVGKKLKEEARELELKYAPNFFGRVDVHCDYFIIDKVIGTVEA